MEQSRAHPLQFARARLACRITGRVKLRFEPTSPLQGRESVIEKAVPFLALDNLKPLINKELESSTYPVVGRSVAFSFAFEIFFHIQ